jgi:hypothetical protein
MSLSVLIIGALAGLIVAGILFLLFRKGNTADLTAPTQEKPAWLRQNPPAERLAAPFAEQIEAIIQAWIEKRPELQHYKLDFGTAPDGGLEIWIDAKKFADVNALPDENLKTLVKEAIELWKMTN